LTFDEPVKTLVLIVDDDLPVRESLARALAYEGCLPVTAADRCEALRLVQSNAFDIVLLGLDLPDEDGWRVLAHLLEAHPAMPVILITAQTPRLTEALAAGADALLEKPLDFPLLLKTIRTLLSVPVAGRLAKKTGSSAPAGFSPRKNPLTTVARLKFKPAPSLA